MSSPNIYVPSTLVERTEYLDALMSTQPPSLGEGGQRGAPASVHDTRVINTQFAELLRKRLDVLEQQLRTGAYWRHVFEKAFPRGEAYPDDCCFVFQLINNCTPPPHQLSDAFSYPLPLYEKLVSVDTSLESVATSAGRTRLDAFYPSTLVSRLYGAGGGGGGADDRLLANIMRDAGVLDEMAASVARAPGDETLTEMQLAMRMRHLEHAHFLELLYSCRADVRPPHALATSSTRISVVGFLSSDLFYPYEGALGNYPHTDVERTYHKNMRKYRSKKILEAVASESGLGLNVMFPVIKDDDRLISVGLLPMVIARFDPSWHLCNNAMRFMLGVESAMLAIGYDYQRDNPTGQVPLDRLLGLEQLEQLRYNMRWYQATREAYLASTQPTRSEFIHASEMARLRSKVSHLEARLAALEERRTVHVPAAAAAANAVGVPPGELNLGANEKETPVHMPRQKRKRADSGKAKHHVNVWAETREWFKAESLIAFVDAQLGIE